jgi:tetratricopeptide (TPR) repeat protein
MWGGLFQHILTRIVPRLLGRLAHSRWFVQWRLRAASGKKITILVAKIDGDGSSAAIQESIIEAIGQGLGESVSIYRWSEALVPKPGALEEVEADLQKTAHTWLERKRCDLLVWGRLKAGVAISLRFTPSEKSQSQPETYVLTPDTLELPTQFISDLGIAIAANITSSVRIAVQSRNYIAPRLRTLAERLDAATRTAGAMFELPIIGTLMHCHALVMLRLFDQSGNRSDLEASIALNNAALSIRTRETVPNDWSTSQNNLGTALARLAAISGELQYLYQAINALKASLEERSPDKSLTRWTGTQLNLANVFLATAQFEDNDANLQSANFIYDLIISPELRMADARLWAIAQNNHGLVLLALADKEIGLSNLTRALDAFTEALEVTNLDEAPFDWASFKGNLGVALLKMGDRKRTLDAYQGASEEFMDALKVITKEQNPKK